MPFGIPHYNAFFVDLPVSSFVSHLSLPTAKDVDLRYCVMARGSKPSKIAYEILKSLNLIQNFKILVKIFKDTTGVVTHVIFGCIQKLPET